MHDFVWFLTLAAGRQDNDKGSWLQMLVPILFVVFYALSGLAKRKAAKDEKTKKDDISELRQYRHRPYPQPQQMSQQKLRYKPLDQAGKAAPVKHPGAVPTYARNVMQQRKIRLPRPQPAFQEQRQTTVQPPRPQPSFRQQQQTMDQPPEQPPAQPTGVRPAYPAGRTLKYRKPAAPAAQPQAVLKTVIPVAPVVQVSERATMPELSAEIGPTDSGLADIISGFSAGYSLRTAVIYSELLGQPLSLRQSGQGRWW